MRLFKNRRPADKSRIRIAIGTVIAVLIVFTIYYLHFHASLERLHLRNLRLLAVMSSQIESAVGGYISAVTSLYENPCPEYTRDVRQFLRKQTSIYPLSHPPEKSNTKTGRGFFIEPDLEGVSWLHLHVQQGSDQVKINPGTAENPPKPACAVSSAVKKPVNAGVNLTSEFEYFMPTDEFGDTFDLVLIANSVGDIVYQSPHTQLHIANLQALFQSAQASALEPEPGGSKKHNTFEEISQTSSLREVKLAGMTYEIYTQPIRLSGVKAKELDNPQWVLCAVARPMNTYKEALRIPLPKLVTIIDLLGLAFFILPWIRIRFLARHERVRRRDVVFGSAAAIFGLVLALALPVYRHSVSQFRARAEEQLRDVSQAVGERPELRGK